MPVVNREAQAGEREEDAEHSGERPMMAPRSADGAEAGGGGRADTPGTEYFFAIDHLTLQKNLQPQRHSRF
jgi:hypothetical protein